MSPPGAEDVVPPSDPPDAFPARYAPPPPTSRTAAATEAMTAGERRRADPAGSPSPGAGVASGTSSAPTRSPASAVPASTPEPTASPSPPASSASRSGSPSAPASASLSATASRSSSASGTGVPFSPAPGASVPAAPSSCRASCSSAKASAPVSSFSGRSVFTASLLRLRTCPMTLTRPCQKGRSAGSYPASPLRGTAMGRSGGAHGSPKGADRAAGVRTARRSVAVVRHGVQQPRRLRRHGDPVDE